MKQFKHIFFWLSGAGADELELCPTWEQRKYVAFGATVLVPTIFAFIACAYALSTITDNQFVIYTVAAAWAFIILTVDRALLSTYRSFQPWYRKLGQFFLRFVVAMLMGLTISHPLTLLLFKDTIRTVIEEEREQEIEQLRGVYAQRKQESADKIAVVEKDIERQRERWNKSFQAEFLAAGEQDGNAGAQDEAADREATALEKKIEKAVAPYRKQLEEIQSQQEATSAEYIKISEELDYWQREFEREVNGQRSGIVGLGPRARSIRDDQLEWRRQESRRLSAELDHLAARKQQAEALIAGTGENLATEHEQMQAVEAEKMRLEQVRIAELRDMVQRQQAEQFVEQQNALRETISSQIDTRLAELALLQEELQELARNESARTQTLRSEPRKDLLTQTLALHGLFKKGEEGGQFALAAYLVLALLFLVVDTIPIVLKFFSKPGPYDTLVDRDELTYDSEREAFLKGYKEYMQKLSGGSLLNLTTNRPLERALVDGVDRSRVAKEFLESLLELETAFETRIQAEREAIKSGASPSDRTAMLEEMAEKFYHDLRARMQSFFDQASPPLKSVRE